MEVHEIAIVTGMAVDKIEDGRVLMSYEVANPDALIRGAGDVEGGGGEVVSWVMREEATSIFNAVSNINRRIPRRLFLGQTSVVIFGQALARDGIGRYLDLFQRKGRFRRSLKINVCDTGTGLLQRPYMEDSSSQTMLHLLHTAELSGRAARVTLNEFIRKLNEPGIEPVGTHTVGRETEDVQLLHAGVEVQQENPAEMLKQPLKSEKNIPSMFSDEHPVLDPLKEYGMAEPAPGMTIMLGLAVFEQDRLVGFLDSNDARGFLWAVGRVKQTAIEIPHPQHDGGTLVLETISNTSTINPQGDSPDNLSIDLEVSIQFQIVESSHPITVKPRAAVEEIESYAARCVEEEIRNSLGIVQNQFESDIYGFGQTLYRRKPELWWELADGWNEKTFPELPVDIDIKTNLRASGLILRGHRE